MRYPDIHMVVVFCTLIIVNLIHFLIQRASVYLVLIYCCCSMPVVVMRIIFYDNTIYYSKHEGKVIFFDGKLLNIYL